MKSVLAALALVVALAGPAAALDRRDPADVTRAFLTAFQAQDLTAMAALVNANNRRLFEEIAAQGSSHPRWSDLFGGWRATAARAWTGALGAPRYRSGEAWVPFGSLAGGELAVLVLTEEDGGWAVEDINSPSREDVERLPIAP